MDRFPHVMKKNGGTVMLTKVGLFGAGEGWGKPFATHTLNVTVGGMINRQSPLPKVQKNKTIYTFKKVSTMTTLMELPLPDFFNDSKRSLNWAIPCCSLSPNNLLQPTSHAG